MTIITGGRGWIGAELHEKVGGTVIDLKDGMNLLTCPLPQADVIYHLAAQSSVEASWKDPVHDADNLRMMVRIVQRYPKAKIIYANSAAALDQASPYGFSKWACGEYLKKFHTNYIICMLPNVYGEGSRSVVDIFKNRDPVTVYGSGKHVRDYVHVDDIVRALVKAPGWPTGEYQLGSGKATSVLELAEGKEVIFAEGRREAKSSILKNNTPNWTPTINVIDYLHD